MFSIRTDAARMTSMLSARMETRELSSIAKAGAAAASMSEFINIRLQQLFGDGRHFDTTIMYLSQGVFRVDISADEVGTYIYYGTAAHSITSPLAMPLGDNRFASRVNHPGTPSRKAEIDAIIQEAMLAFRAGNAVWGF